MLTYESHLTIGGAAAGTIIHVHKHARELGLTAHYTSSLS